MCPIKVIAASSLINREMTKIGQAAWLCGSLPLGCIITYLEKILFASKTYVSMLSLFGRRLLIPTVGDIHSIHSSEMSGRSCVAGLQDVLVEPSVFLSRGTLAKGGSIPCHSWKSITQYVLAVLIVYYICRT